MPSTSSTFGLPPPNFRRQLTCPPGDPTRRFLDALSDFTQDTPPEFRIFQVLAAGKSYNGTDPKRAAFTPQYLGHYLSVRWWLFQHFGDLVNERAMRPGWSDWGGGCRTLSGTS